MIRPILIHPDARLRKVCAPVEDIDAALQQLIDDMFETMHAAPGIGLAAPQVGVLRRFFVMDCAKEEEAPEPLVFINPEITWRSEARVEMEEGCLSIPEVYAQIERPAAVRVRFTNRDGGLEERDFDGLRARCVQHEIDHLDGRLFIDYLSPVRRQMITRKMQKLKRERARARPAAE